MRVPDDRPEPWAGRQENAPEDPAPFDQYLERLVAAVADGIPVDWADAEARAATLDDRQRLEQLRLLADMAAASGHSTDQPLSAGSPSPSDTRDWVAETPAPSKDGRFVIERCLGKGGFGVVHKAYDQERKTHVALKSFIRPGVESVYAFKKEFRVLADLAHPNLVSLYELFADEDSWFIAMELVPGVDFLTYVRGGTAADSDSGSVDFGKPAAPCSLPRLGRAMTQLGLALAYLHGEGKLHCDIKPSNVLITEDGHLKLVDFGLATDVAPAPSDDTQRIRGTPAYVSPEHAAGGRPTAASDWYGVGVMLFEALTGERPFQSTVSQVLEAKQQRTAPAAGSLRSGIPEGLDALCSRLLARNPGDRPSDAEILGALQQIWPTSDAASEHAAVRAERVPFVGRQAQIALLDRAFEASMLGSAQTVFLHGASGIGKTALVRRFLGVLRERESDIVILEGRCSERESVPYKALDSLIDQLSLYLRKLPRSQADALLPRDSGALARLFPVLRRVDALVELRQRPDQASDAHELRRRGCAALRELLARLVDRHPVVIVIDDLQWTDADSAALIADMIFEDEASPLLFIGCYRTEEGATNAALGALLAAADAALRRGRCTVQTVGVDELSIPEAYELADTLTLKHRATAAIDSIVRESGRSPFFINQLIQYSAMTPTTETAAPDAFPEDTPLELTLDSVIRARTAWLGDGARRLLQVLAVFGGPLELSIAGEVAGLGPAALGDSMALRAARLTRSRIAGSEERIEVYHDRIREAIAADIPPADLKELHGRLALVLQHSISADPEALLHHFHGADENESAAVYAILAGDRAREALAFGRAAEAYRFALDFGYFEDAGRRAVRIKLGEALAASGRGYDAAQAYLAAAAHSDDGQGLELKRRAAEQLLQSGYLDEGLQVVYDVLRRVGLRLPPTPRQALVSLLLLRARIKLRGLRFTERDATEIDPGALVAVDTCWSVTSGLAIVDHIRSAEFGARHLLLALSAGEPLRIVRALAMELAYTSIVGASSQPQNERMIEIAEGLIGRVKNPEARGLLTLAKGSAAYMQGQWIVARELCESAERILRERGTGVAWQIDTAQFYTMLLLFYLGEIGELSRRLPALLKAARERDARYAETILRTRISYIAYLATDDVAGASAAIREGMERWSQKGFHNQHYYEMVATANVLLYSGDGTGAWKWIEKKWRDLGRTLLLRVQPVLIESLHLRARAALAAALDPSTDRAERATLIRSAEKDAQRLHKIGAPWGMALAELIFSGVAALRGAPARAATHLETAEAAFLRAHMGLYLAATRRRRGELLQGPEGDRLRQSADDWMRQQSIADPARFAQMLTPGVQSPLT